MYRGLPQILLAAGLMLSTMAPADARSRACHRLQAQLTALSHMRSKAALATRYDRAIAAQREQLRNAGATARRSGCTGLLSLFGSPGGRRCAGIDATISRMKRNLATLQAKREILSGRGSAEAERRRVVRALESEGCDGAPASLKMASAKLSGIGKPDGAFDETLGNGIVVHRSSPADNGEASGKPAADDAPQIPAIPAGTYSTLCVRTCDGFYFPISYATTPKNFAQDERICEARCPGAEAHLYYHRVDGQEAEDMVSLTGVPYRSLPTAFLYRRTDRPQPKSCGCGAVDYSAIGETPSDEANPSAGQPASSPQPDIMTVGEPPRPAKPVETPSVPEQATPASDANRNVRVVGPKFFPDPSTAIDLRAPDRKDGP
jgi:hypothetical protein